MLCAAVQCGPIMLRVVVKRWNPNMSENQSDRMLNYGRSVRLLENRTVQQFSLRPLSGVTRETRPVACVKELSHILQGTWATCLVCEIITDDLTW